jgi:NADH:ubiquinone oxidoreductase subunit E
VTIYPLKRSALVPMLLYAQDEIGYVSDAVIQLRLPSGSACSSWTCATC